MKYAFFFALVTALSPGTAHALCSGEDNLAQASDAVEYIFRNSDLVGIGVIESDYRPGISEQRIRPLSFFKGVHSNSLTIGEKAGENGSIKLDVVGRNFQGDVGSIVLFSLSRKGDRFVRSECATPVLEGPNRLKIIEVLFKPRQ